MDDRDRKSHHDEDVNLESPLGIARTDVPKDPEIRASGDEKSVRRRRRRAGVSHEVEERRSTGIDDLDQQDPFGATGIDMGSGGQGTDIKRSR